MALTPDMIKRIIGELQEGLLPRKKVFRKLVGLGLALQLYFQSTGALCNEPCGSLRFLDSHLTQPDFQRNHGHFVQVLREQLRRQFGSSDNMFLTTFLTIDDADMLRVFHALRLFLKRANGAIDPTPGTYPISGRSISELMSQDDMTRSRLEQLFLGAYFRQHHTDSSHLFATGDRLATLDAHQNLVFDFIEYEIDKQGNLRIYTVGEVKHREHAHAIRQMQTTINRIRRAGLRIDEASFPPEQIFIKNDNGVFKPLRRLPRRPGSTPFSTLKQTRQYFESMAYLFLRSKHTDEGLGDGNGTREPVIHFRDSKGAQRFSFLQAPFSQAMYHLTLFYMSNSELATHIERMAMTYHFTYDRFVQKLTLPLPPTPGGNGNGH